MGLRQVDFAKVRTQPGGFHVTIPKETVALPLSLKKGDRLRVKIDEKHRRWVYEVISQPNP